MSRIAYVNGRYVPLRDAFVHIEDRGYQFADGVYEGIAVRKGGPVDRDPHIARLYRSMAELAITPPVAQRAWPFLLNTMIRRNHIRDGFLYIQVTRGVARRDHPFPSESLTSLVITCRPVNFDAVARRARGGVAAITARDERWPRADIKSISLLPNILAKQKAREAGAFEAVLVDGEGLVTEGSSTNIWIVKDGVAITRSAAFNDQFNILAGITRATLMQVAKTHDIQVKEAAFSVADALKADEMFLTSSTGCVTPIVTLDGTAIGTGTPGPIGLALVEAYMAYMG